MITPHTSMPQHTIKTALSLSIPFISQQERELILAHVTTLSRSFIIAHPEHLLTQDQYTQYIELLTNRADGIPLAYLTGIKYFYNKPFHVTPDTLIPRPESEDLIDIVMRHTVENMLQKFSFVDIGTGSGNIVITLVHACIEKKITASFGASDISCKALDVARVNAYTHNTVADITFFHSDLLSAKSLQKYINMSTIRDEQLILVANLPYVDVRQKNILLNQNESRALAHEPAQALWSADGGLAHYKRLIAETIAYHACHPTVPITSFYEIDPGQKDLLTRLLSPYIPIFYNDLSSRIRVCKWTL